jgi:hypothetical protein
MYQEHWRRIGSGVTIRTRQGRGQRSGIDGERCIAREDETLRSAFPERSCERVDAECQQQKINERHGMKRMWRSRKERTHLCLWSRHMYLLSIFGVADAQMLVECAWTQACGCEGRDKDPSVHISAVCYACVQGVHTNRGLPTL